MGSCSPRADAKQHFWHFMQAPSVSCRAEPCCRACRSAASLSTANKHAGEVQHCTQWKNSFRRPSAAPGLRASDMKACRYIHMWHVSDSPLFVCQDLPFCAQASSRCEQHAQHSELLMSTVVRETFLSRERDFCAADLQRMCTC